MNLLGGQWEALHAALKEAFNKDDLTLLARAKLDEDLEVITDGGNLAKVTLDLIRWAERQGRLDDLVKGAEELNSGNQKLKAFAAAYWAAKAAAPPPPDPPQLATALLVEPEPPAPERPLVDRVELVELLTKELRLVNEGRRGRSCVLVGDSGVGKSRLAERAGRMSRESGMLVLQAQCVGQGAEALLPLRDALTSFGEGGRLEQALRNSPGATADSAEFVRAFLRLDHPAPGGPQLGGSLDKGVYEGLAKVLLGLAAARGLCLVVEDLTEADPDTLYFLDYLWRKADASRVLTVSTAKGDLLDHRLDDRLNKWVAEGWKRSDVPPLQPQDAAELVSIFWNDPPLADDRVRQIVELSGGNPFFIEQILNLLTEDPALIESLNEVPPRVQAVLERRLDRMDEDTRAFLDAAAVALEAAFSLELVAHVAEVDERTALKFLRKACELGSLVELEQGGVTFVQELLRRVVYEQIRPLTSRRRMHLLAAEWLENAELFSSAVGHYEHAGRTDDLVRTALEGARRAEHGGLYRSAVQLYERARPFVDDIRRIGLPMARACLVVGKWDEATELLDLLPPEEREVRVLRSEICFVRGNFSGALEEMELVLQAAPDDLDSLIRLSDINLYLGDLGDAADNARQALAIAAEPARVAKCKGLLGAAAFFGGDVDVGERLYAEAEAVLAAQPEAERDRAIYSTILGNLGQVNEVRGRWEEAKKLHEQALSLRRSVSDARGELHSLHGVSRAEIGMGSLDEGARRLEEARKLAVALGEELEQTKIDHTSAWLALLRGDPAEAGTVAGKALQRFRASRVAYDTADARFTLTRSLAAAGSHRRAVEEGSKARADATRKGFGLLSKVFPELAFSWSARVEAGLLAYACGDALGLPWEGRPPDQVDHDRILALPATAEWPHGATSDDTALTFLVSEHLVTKGTGHAIVFLELLAARAPGIRGLGPSTAGAIEHFRSTGTAPTEGGNTNGAVMRSLPVGWAFPLDRVLDRREEVVALSRVTHTGPDASLAACVGAACAAWAIEGANRELLLQVAQEEAAVMAAPCGADDRLEHLLSSLGAGGWRPPESGVTLDPYETLVSALWCIKEEPTLVDALLAAVRIGGDTDTVASLVGGLLGCQKTPDEVEAELPWISEVQMPERAVATQLAAGLADLRSRRPDG